MVVSWEVSSFVPRLLPPLVFDHLQYTKYGGREIWLRALMKGTRGRGLEALSCTGGGNNVSKAASIPFIIHDTGDGSTWNGKKITVIETPHHLTCSQAYLLHICTPYLHNLILPIIHPLLKISQSLLLKTSCPTGFLLLKSMPTLLPKLGKHWSASGRSTMKEFGLANEESLATAILYATGYSAVYWHMTWDCALHVYTCVCAVT